MQGYLPQPNVVFAVSPLTGHVIGTGAFKVVSSPSRPGKVLAFRDYDVKTCKNCKCEISRLKLTLLLQCEAPKAPATAHFGKILRF